MIDSCVRSIVNRNNMIWLVIFCNTFSSWPAELSVAVKKMQPRGVGTFARTHCLYQTCHLAPMVYLLTCRPQELVACALCIYHTIHAYERTKYCWQPFWPNLRNPNSEQEQNIFCLGLPGLTDKCPHDQVMMLGTGAHV